MGLNSTIRVKCTITFSVTNATYDTVQSKIRTSDFKEILHQKTNGYVKVIGNPDWQSNHNVGGALVGRILLGPAGWTYPSIVYDLSIDTYNLIKDSKGTVVAQMSKAFKKSRSETIIQKLQQEIKLGFTEKLKEGTFTHLAVTLISVDIK